MSTDSTLRDVLSETRSAISVEVCAIVDYDTQSLEVKHQYFNLRIQ